MLLLPWEYAFLHSPTHIPHPLRKCSTPTLGEDTQKYSIYYSTYPINPQLSQLILPTIIIELKGMADLKRKREKREKERKRTKVPMQKKRKTAKSMFSD